MKFQFDIWSFSPLNIYTSLHICMCSFLFSLLSKVHTHAHSAPIHCEFFRAIFPRFTCCIFCLSTISWLFASTKERKKLIAFILISRIKNLCFQIGWQEWVKSMNRKKTIRRFFFLSCVFYLSLIHRERNGSELFSVCSWWWWWKWCSRNESGGVLCV